MKIIAILMLFPFLAFSQNLVPNNSFEVYTSCPNNPGQVNKATPWTELGSADYFNTCASNPALGVPNNTIGFQNARLGNGYTGLYVYFNGIPDSREYVQVQLNDTLIAGLNYKVSFYVNLADNVKYATDAIGAVFSATAIAYPSLGVQILNYPPQISNSMGNIITDTAGWTLISRSFTAFGGEEYLTIGNFKYDSLTNVLIVNSGSSVLASYYYIDDVSVTPDTATNIKESPISTKSINEITIYPNPNKGLIKVDYSFETGDKINCFITDITGQKVLEMSFSGQKKHQEISTQNLTNGIYVINFVVNDELIKKEKLIIIK